MKVKALVTGHSTGLGLGLTEALCRQGVLVMGVARRQLQTGPHGLLAQCSLDLSDLSAAESWLQSDVFKDWWSDADQALLINNAGVVTPVAPPGRQGVAAIADTIALNVTAPLMAVDAFVQATQHCSDRRIVHVSSGAARSAYSGWSIYCASKAALDHHARAVALDAVPNLKIVSLAPGVIDTEMQGVIRGVEEELFPNRQRFVEMKQNSQLADPAQAGLAMCRYLLSDQFGEEVCVDLRNV